MMVTYNRHSRSSEIAREAVHARYALISVLSMMQGDGLLEIEWNKHMLHQEPIRDWTTRLEAAFDRIFEIGNSQILGRDCRVPKVIGIDTGNAYDAIESKCQRLGVELSDVEAVYLCFPVQDSLMLSQSRRPNGVYQDYTPMFSTLTRDLPGIHTRMSASQSRPAIHKESPPRQPTPYKS